MTSRRIGWVLFGAWAVLSIGILGQFLFDNILKAEADIVPWVRGELEVKLGLELLILNFPMSVVVAAVGPEIPMLKEAGPVTEWCVLTLAGLVQWAFLVPILVERVRRLLARGRHPSSNALPRQE